MRYDALQLDNVLKAAGFTETEPRRVAWAVAMRESRGTPDIVGGPNGNGTYDYGLFQLNEIHRKTIGEEKWAKILEGPTNAAIVAGMTNEGQNWGSWGLGDSGWAGWLKENNPEIYQQMYNAWKVFYDRYPADLAAIAGLQNATAVEMDNLKPGLRNTDVKIYQTKLRAYLGTTLSSQLNPSGATGYFGGETKALTTAAYKRVAQLTGQSSWLKGDLTYPGPGLVQKLGLRPI